MLVNSVKNNISFKKALKDKELGRFVAVQQKAKEAVGQTGQSIFIVHDVCLPQSEGKNTGTGTLSSKESLDFFAYMKPYLGFNTVEVLPGGELRNEDGLYCAYAGSSLSLGSHQINPELLLSEEFGKLLTEEEYEDIVKANSRCDKATIVNYENVVDKNGAQETALKKAFARFSKLDDDTKLKQNYRAFVKKNDDWICPKAIYQILIEKYSGYDFTFWDECDRRLFDPSYDPKKRADRIAEIIKENGDDIEFYKFKQFLAQSHLSYAKKRLNAMGIKLTGDCPIGFSRDEVWAYPKAFSKQYRLGEMDWMAPSLDYDTIKDPKSASAQLLSRKVGLYAERYDGIRFDAAWAYTVPKVHYGNGNVIIKELGDDVLELIEEAVKAVKGEDFDLKNLSYEFAGGKIFNGTQLIPPVEKRMKIFDTQYMKDTLQDTYGSNDAFLKRGFDPDYFIVGVSNHDSQPLRQIANNIPDAVDGGKSHKLPAIEPLSNILKLNKKELEDPVQFAKAKWAEPMMAKNNMIFYMDVFGREERFNMHGENRTVHPWKNFAYKIPSDYKNALQKAIQEGYGFNIMDSLEKIFKAKGLDKTQPKLYLEIVKFRDILNEDGAKGVNSSVLKSNKYIKPLIIGIASVALAAFAVKSFLLKDNTPQNKPKGANIPFNPQNMDDFINKAKSL